MRILVAEDEPAIARTYKLILEDKGHDVSVAYDGESCIKSYKSALAAQGGKMPYELVILNYMMPKKDGLQVAREILSVCPAQRIVIASAFSADNLAESLENAGSAIRVLQKPFGLEELISVVELESRGNLAIRGSQEAGKP
jgi:DNA-binding response OmpR family regulator